jgi:protein-tyrosine phosphatase
MAESLKMARQAVAVGTTIMAATPHRWAGPYQQDPQNIISRVLDLQTALDSAGIPLKIIPGVEAPVAPDLADDLEAHRILPIGGARGRHVLIEPPFQEIPEFVWGSLRRVKESGYTPILAHPERNRQVQVACKQHGSLALIEACVEIGCIVQLTSGSLVGLFGSDALAVSRAVVQHADWPVILASDSHESRERRPDQLGIAADQVAVWTGDSARARAMVDDLPHSLLP